MSKGNISKRTASLLAIISGLLMGTLNLFLSEIYARGLDSYQASAVRFTLSAVFFAAGMAVMKRDAFRIRLRDLWMFVLNGAGCLAGFGLLYAYTVRYGQISVAVVLIYTAPIWVNIASVLFFGESFGARKAAALLCAFAGCVCVSGILSSSLNMKPFLFLTGLGSGIAYAGYSITGELILKRYGSHTLSLYAYIFAAIAALTLARPSEIAARFAAQPSLILWGTGLALFSCLIPLMLYGKALEVIEVSKASILITVEVLMGEFIGIVIYGESCTLAKLAGIVLIMSAIVILNTGRK